MSKSPVFQKPPEGHGDVLRWRDFYVATLEKTQLIAKDFPELRIHFWPDLLGNDLKPCLILHSPCM
ncbi:predicted protein [Histoplasma mississippiense (nom. inval.)]|uniref:predicted protein n=1 Tax=Ajellomyces capsulatus (strain NAm1 / WU24) TaxID=2059318 RepID=UPI000157C86A|nr:predicted protein [Histoplasma mississippiense (nom. inval.)]EDN09860.1 predicted protein [Histoplasma mississippiense (nom. inval.)]